MRKVGTIVVGMVWMCLATVYVSSAAGTRHRQAVEELFSVVDMASVINQTMEQSLQLQIRQRPGLGPYRDVMKEFLARYMSWDSLKDDFVQMYVKEFTERELRED